MFAGWSHVVISGRDNDKNINQIVHAAWGRNDMGQISCCGVESQNPHIKRPQIVLDPIEDGIERTLGQIVCGSEYTLARDIADGSLYACGWNEHGNLGSGDIINGNKGWRKVHVDIEYNSQFESRHRLGCEENHTRRQSLSIAAGGAHCLVSLT